MSYVEENKVTFADGPQLDAFNRLRVSNPVTLFDDKRRYGKGETTWSEILIGSATSAHDANTSSINMTVTSNGDVAVRQTRQRYKYQSGKGQLIDCTGILNPETGTKKHIGYVQVATTGLHVPHDGICFETIDNVMYATVYNVGVPERVAQSAWNKDKMDGTGPSGITVDWSKTQIFIIDFQWLGVGRVRVGLNINGMTYIVHELNHANILTDVYMRSGTQPISYRVESTGSAGTFKQICCTIQSQGGTEPTGVVAAIDRDGSSGNLAISTSLVGLIGIRLKTAELDAIVEVLDTVVLSLSNDSVRWCLAWNPPAIAGTVTWTPITGGHIEVAKGTGTNIVTEGLIIDSGYMSSTSRVASNISLGNLKLGATVNAVPDQIWLCVQSLAGSATVTGGLTIRELT